MNFFDNQLKKINKILKDFNKSINIINQVEHSLNFQQILEESFHLAKISENLTEHVRLLPSFTGYNKSQEEIEKIIIENNVSVSCSNDVIHIKMNSLLPKKENERAGYIRTNLIVALKHYCENNNVEIITEPVVVVFKHNYSDKHRMWRDHDNVEINVVMDALALYFLSDDTSKSCDHFYFSSPSDYDNTDIYIIKQTKFHKWLSDNYKT